jgi:dihydrofolate reductase
MQINLIWAQAQGRVIGLNGKMPWHLPEDLAHFKRSTQGHPVIMGRKTWDSLPAKFQPLPGRLNAVISRDAGRREHLRKSGCTPFQSLRDALIFCEQQGMDEVWVIGGAQVYLQALPLAHQLVITEIDAAFEGDALAPVLDSSWHEVKRELMRSQQGINLSFLTYARA